MVAAPAADRWCVSGFGSDHPGGSDSGGVLLTTRGSSNQTKPARPHSERTTTIRIDQDRSTDGQRTVNRPQAFSAPTRAMKVQTQNRSFWTKQETNQSASHRVDSQCRHPRKPPARSPAREKEGVRESRSPRARFSRPRASRVAPLRRTLRRTRRCKSNPAAPTRAMIGAPLTRPPRRSEAQAKPADISRQRESSSIELASPGGPNRFCSSFAPDGIRARDMTNRRTAE